MCIRDSDHPGQRSPLQRALEGETTRNQESRVVRSDGSERWRLVSAGPVYNERGDLIAAFVACLLYTSDAADERSSVDLGGRRIL